MWRIFDRGVCTAKAENESLGLVVDEAVSYSDSPEQETILPRIMICDLGRTGN
jgi:hypothetical protein